MANKDKNNVAISVKNVTKEFTVYEDKSYFLKEKIGHLGRNKKRKHVVLKDISVDILRGQSVALVGVNGCGKSTLLKLLNKIIYPQKGTIEINGKVSSMIELGAGFNTDFTGRENIYFNASIFGLTRAEIDTKIDDIIEFSELGDFIDNPIRTYSSGMYMRLAFSVAINVQADIILIDEILAVGDQHFQDKCFKKLHELKKAGKTIVIVTHSMNQVQNICDRAVWLYKGEVRMDGSVNKVLDEYIKVCG